MCHIHLCPWVCVKFLSRKLKKITSQWRFCCQSVCRGLSGYYVMTKHCEIRELLQVFKFRSGIRYVSDLEPHMKDPICNTFPPPKKTKTWIGWQCKLLNRLMLWNYTTKSCSPANVASLSASALQGQIYAISFHTLPPNTRKYHRSLWWMS